MAATPSRATPALSREFPTLIKTPPSLHLSKPDLSVFLSKQKKQKIIRSELKSFENSHPWNLENDRIHLIHGTSANPMAVAAALDHSSSKRSKKICLFYCAETKALAERVAAEYDGIELRSIRWRTFEDGFPNLFISNAHGIRGQHVAFLASFSSPGVIFEQLSVIYALPRMFISSFTLVLPFFPTGSSERIEEEGDVATAFTLARILSNIPISRGGPTSLVIFDIHALQERFYFGDKVLPCFESGVPMLKNRLQELPDSDNISIAFPDDGAWKRFNKQLQHFPMIICNKVREGDQRIVRLKEGDPKGRHVVIVDDLVQSGGTLVECQKVLADNGAAKISAYVTHGIFPNRSWERFQHDNGGTPDKGLTYFWITDSCPLTVKEVKNRRPFEILSLAGSIAATLQI
ncbi:ribose-phosphate pyrophosphokinase 3, mitochondrial-like isoform X1 [Magnolia sinica]|uniref:ribose-phosphate pyrophosphokinase 3, mitochondrial-like isoform X1 n=1 Tax=Magnolia sinica TaxID=86752 RepID=UPI00265B5C0A|nr:ribose-phosphate pyrophosphokinase 3, mitochondrial-like isoform X1 [Magnolia sinica]